MFMIGLTSANAQNLVDKANAEYNKDNYKQALELYLQATKEDGTSSDLYYNIGNTYYRLGDLGNAVLYFERALILNPRNDDARTNLEFVNSKIETRILDEKSFVLQIIDSIVEWQSSNTWAIISAICFLLLICNIILYIFADTIFLRKIGFFGGGIVFIVTIFSLLCAFSMKSRVEAQDKAIIISPSVTLSTVPRQPKGKTEEAFTLTAGNKVTIVDSVENKNGDKIELWLEVKADDKHRAWLKKEHLKSI